MKKIMNKNEKGITLIALVITIIVLLILAGVAIAMLSGENGIITKANSAKTENESSTIEEQVKLAVMAALASGNGEIKGTDAFKALNDGLKDAGYNVEIKEETVTWPVTVEIGESSFKIDKNGVVENKPNNEIEWDYAYICEDGAWTEVEKGKEASGKIVAKLYRTGSVDTTGNSLGMPEKEIPSYRLSIEGEGEMAPLAGEGFTTAWLNKVSSFDITINEAYVSEGITNISYGAFLASIYLTDLDIPEGVTSIGGSAFYNCSSLKTINIPKSLKRIDDAAFEGCEILTDIYYNGSQEEWNSITIEGFNDVLNTATIHCNS